jgi:hypothetical protein
MEILRLVQQRLPNKASSPLYRYDTSRRHPPSPETGTWGDIW